MVTRLLTNITSSLGNLFRKPAEPKPEPPTLHGTSLLILKDSHKSKDGISTSIEVRSDGIHLHTENGEERIIPVTEDVFSLSSVDEEIRYQIARKISLLVPSLADPEKQELLKHVFRMLNSLANDQLVRVRKMIAEELRDSYNAPQELISKLAWDEELEVAAPILEYSPLLSEQDLMEIIGQCDIPGVCEAVAKRRNVPETISDAIVRCVTRARISRGDARVITALLENKTAQLGEETMETLIDKAPAYEIWHESLIERPEMTTRMLNKVARFVSQSMLQEMTEKGMISEELGKNLMMAVASRLQSLQVDREKEADKEAVELFTQRRLDSAVVMAALEGGERDFVVAAISLLADLPKNVTIRMLKSADPKAVIALSWKAGLLMRDSIQVQLKVARIHHTKIMYAKKGSDFPLSESAMQKLIAKFL